MHAQGANCFAPRLLFVWDRSTCRPTDRTNNHNLIGKILEQSDTNLQRKRRIHFYMAFSTSDATLFSRLTSLQVKWFYARVIPDSNQSYDDFCGCSERADSIVRSFS